MRILVTGGEHAERTERRHDATGERPRASRRRRQPHAHADTPAEGAEIAFVLCDAADEPPGLLLHLVRYTGTPAPHVVVVAHNPSEQFLKRAYECGAESDLRAPYSGAYLNARVEVVRRRAEPDRKPPPPPEVNRPAARPVVTFGSALDLVSRSTAWFSAQESLKNATGQFLDPAGLPLRGARRGEARPRLRDHDVERQAGARAPRDGRRDRGETQSLAAHMLKPRETTSPSTSSTR